MFEYIFVSVPVTFEQGTIAPSSYQSVVHEHAAQGWRLVQLFVPLPAAMPSEYVLIFERPASQNVDASA